MSKIRSVSNQAGYDLWSGSYDSYLNPTIAADELIFPQKWQHLHEKSILEIGCGTGRHTRRLLSQKNQVTALDLSEGMLAEAMRKIQDPNVQFHHADFLSHSFSKEKQFDAIIESLVLEHIKDLEAFFAKAFSLLSPGGSLFLSEIHPFRSSQGILAHFKLSGEEDEFHLQSHPHTRQQIESAASQSGFQRIEFDEQIADETFIRRHEKWKKYLNQPLVATWHLRKEGPDASLDQR